MWKLPVFSSSGSSKCCPFQNISITPVLRAVKPTAGFSPMNHTGMECQSLEVARGSVASIDFASRSQMAARCGSRELTYDEMESGLIKTSEHKSPGIAKSLSRAATDRSAAVDAARGSDLLHLVPH